MKYISMIFLSVVFFVTQSFSQNVGGIELTEIQKMRQAFEADAANVVRMNALSNNAIKDIALNRANMGSLDHNFKYRVKVKGISDQKSSGRCWLFTSYNVLRPLVIDKYKLSDFEFSHNYLFFWDQFEKANLFLENIIAHADEEIDSRYNHWLLGSPVGDGGVWSSFTNLVVKYGLVPSTIMPETHNSDNTSYMSRMLNRKLREFAIELRQLKVSKTKPKDIAARKLEMMSTVYRMLALNFGVPPESFEYRFVTSDGDIGETKQYTPQSFAQEVLPDVVYTDYVMLMNDPTRDYYKLYEIDNDRNVMEGRNWIYINLPSDEIKKYAVLSIKANDAMYASCDVGKQLNSDLGVSDVDNYDFESVYNVKFGMDKKDRILTRESGSSHGMALIAVDVDKDENPIKWQFENSWGVKSGHNGYLTFTDQWFDEFMFRVVVLKKHLPESVLKILDQTPTMLPPWDPMFNADF